SSSRSNSVTAAPRRASSCAKAHPMTPPPTTITCDVARPDMGRGYTKGGSGSERGSVQEVAKQQVDQLGDAAGGDRATDGLHGRAVAQVPALVQGRWVDPRLTVRMECRRDGEL